MKKSGLTALIIVPVCHLLMAQSQPPAIPSFNTEDCKQITRRGPDLFYVDGPVKYGPIIISKSTIGRDGIKVGSFTLFEVIEAICFNKPT